MTQYIIIYKIRSKLTYLRSYLVILYYNLQGAKISYNALIHGNVLCTWPHKIKIDHNTLVEHSVFFKHDGPYTEGKTIIIGQRVFIGANCEFNIRKKVTINDNCLIASGCKFIDHDHGVNKNKLINEQQGPEGEILIEKDVWLGVNVVVLKGVIIGKGAIVAAGAIVNKSIPSYEIWAGVPARKIGERR